MGPAHCRAYPAWLRCVQVEGTCIPRDGGTRNKEHAMEPEKDFKFGNPDILSACILRPTVDRSHALSPEGAMAAPAEQRKLNVN